MGSVPELARTGLIEASLPWRSAKDEALNLSAPGVDEAALLRQHPQLILASLYFVPCLLFGFGPYPLWLTRCPAFPAAPVELDSQPESSWSRCEEAGAVPAIQEVAPAVCKVWQVGSMAGEARTGHPAPSSFPGQP